ncbi:MAG TPA: haloacid dehalogenase type II [Thermoleophilaceae bacterium]
MQIAFDAFGTLFDIEWLRKPARDLAGERGDALYDAFYSRLQPWTWLATAADAYRPLPELARAALESAAAELELDVEAGALAERLTELPLFPEAERALEALGGNRLAVLSNGTPDGLEALLSNAGIRRCFEHVLAAHSVGRYKPAPEVYALAPRAFGVEPNEVTLVSGNPWDAAGAKLAGGLRSVWVSRGRPMAPVLDVTPDEVVEDLTGLTFAGAA